MAFPITCPTCGKAFTLADDIYEKKVAGKVVSIKCRQCQSGIRIDATQPGELKVIGATPAGGGNMSVGAKPPGAAAAVPEAAPVRPRQPTLIGGMNPAGEIVTQGAAPAAPAAATGAWAVDSGGIGEDRELTDDEIAREIAAGKLKPDTLVWREGQGEWQEVKNIPALAKHLPPPKQPLVPRDKAPEAKPLAPPEPPPPPPPVEAKRAPAPEAPAVKEVAPTPEPKPVEAPAAKEATSPIAPKVASPLAPRAKEASAPVQPKPATPEGAPRAKLPAVQPKPATPEGAPRAKLPSAAGITPGAPAAKAASAGAATLPGTPRAKQPSAAGLPPPRAKQASGLDLPPARAKQPSGLELPPARAKQPSGVDLPPPRVKQPSGVDLPPPRVKQPSGVELPPPRAKQPSAPMVAPPPPPPAAPHAPVGLDEEEATAIYDRSSPEAAAKLAALGFPADALPPDEPELPPPPPPPAAGRPAMARPVSPAPAPPPLPPSAPAAAPPPFPQPAAAPPPPLPQAPAYAAPTTPVAPAFTPMGAPPAIPSAPRVPAGVAAASAPMVSAPLASAPMAPAFGTADVDFPAPKSKMPLVFGGIVAVAVIVGIVVAVSSSGSAPPPPPPPTVPTTPVAAPEPASTPTSTPTPASNPAAPPSPIENTPPGGKPAPAPGGGFSDLFAQGAQMADKPGTGRAFDQAEARKAVAAVLPNVARCKEAGGAVGQSTAAITFEASGNVSSVTVGAPFSGSSTGTCIIGALKEAKVAPFSGLPGTISHPVSLR